MTGFLFEKYSEPLAAPNTAVPAQDRERTANQRARILERLREGPAYSDELADNFTHRFSARIHELRKAGHDIETRRVGGSGLFVFTLKG